MRLRLWHIALAGLVLWVIGCLVVGAHYQGWI